MKWNSRIIELKPISISLAIVLAAMLMGLGPAVVPGTLNYPVPLSSGIMITGPITNIDPVNRMVQIKDKDGVIETIRVSSDVRIMRQGEQTRLSDLSRDDVVTVLRK